MKPTRDLKQIIEAEIAGASSYLNSELSDNRTKALDYYHGEPRGDEIEGRSKVISTDVADAVEWVMPQVVKTFLGSDEIIRFDPVGEGDEDQAEQESDYVNYVVTKENNSFLVFNTWFRDALLQKTGVVKAYWQEEEKEREEYEGLNDQELADLLSEDGVEPVEHSETLSEMGVLHDVVIHRVSVPGRVKIDPIPPEEFLVNDDHNSIDLSQARFTCHESLVPASDLIEQGFDAKVVDSLPAYDRDDDEEDVARDHLSMDDDDSGSADWSMRRVRVYECYIRMDSDDDGIAELRQVIYAGKQVLSDEPVDRNPFCALTAILQPHRYYGLSIYDRLKQVQDQKTAILRQLFDNLYASNNQQVLANQEKVNLSDLLTRRPNGVIRVKDVANPLEAVAPLPTVPIGAQSFQMLEYLNRQREERVGVGPEMMGQNQSLSNDTAHGIERIMSAKEELVGLMIRTFAETGVKSLFLLVRELLMKHQDKEKVFRLRDKWVPVRPSEWRKRMNSTIKVGLGTGDRMKQLNTLSKVLEAQRELVAGGAMGTLVQPKHIFNALEDFTNIGGLVNANKYFLDPQSDEAQQLAQQKAMQPKEPDPAQQLIQLQAEVERQKAENDRARLEIEAAKFQRQTEIDQIEAQSKAQERAAKAAMDAQATHAKANADDERLASDMAIKARELDLKERELALKYEKPADDVQAAMAQVQMMREAMAQFMRQLAAPKKVVRDEYGNAVGVAVDIDAMGEADDATPEEIIGRMQSYLSAPRRIVRDQNGNAVSVVIGE